MKNLINYVSMLPNKHGFEFVGVMKDGQEIDCIVLKDVFCQHRAFTLYTRDDIYSKLIGWRETPKKMTGE